MTFVRNNIRYRSAASKALEGYYNSKAFILNELISPNNGFSGTAKEILLLLFNKHADWLTYVESLLLDKEKVSVDDVIGMKKGLDNVYDGVQQIFSDHPDVFEKDFVVHWTYIHELSMSALRESLLMAVGMPQIISFPFATECLVEYLNSTLFELYELDTLLGSNLVKTKLSTNDTQPDRLIMFIDDAGLRHRHQTGELAETRRFSYYIDNLLDGKSNFSIELRDYSRSGDREENVRIREKTCTELQRYFSDAGLVQDIKIIRPHCKSKQCDD